MRRSERAAGDQEVGLPESSGIINTQGGDILKPIELSSCHSLNTSVCECTFMCVCAFPSNLCILWKKLTTFLCTPASV